MWSHIRKKLVEETKSFKTTFRLNSRPSYPAPTRLNLDCPSKYVNHRLIGEYKEYWDCHITNDCVLIYKIIDNELRLARIGTHSELFR